MEINEKTVTEVSFLLLARMAQKYGGDCTLNELRVANAVSVRSLAGERCSPTLLSEDTGIPKSTVSRSLASLISKGWLIDQTDPRDRRRRIIQLSDLAIQRRSEDLREVIDWMSKRDSNNPVHNNVHRSRMTSAAAVAERSII